jgi:Helix-turn-helix
VAHVGIGHGLSPYLKPEITPSTEQSCPSPYGWSQQDLAREAQVGVVTLHQREAGTSEPRRETLDVIRRAFEAAGVKFIEENGGGPGVRLRKAHPPKRPK